MKSRVNPLLAVALALASATADAQEPPAAATAQPHDVLQLSASASVDVEQDTLQVSLNVTRQGEAPAAVQAQLKTVLDAALAQARAEAAEGTDAATGKDTTNGKQRAARMQVRTGRFSLSPRYDQGGKLVTWQGSAELILEGTDFDRITQTAGTVADMVVRDVAFSLSRQGRASSESEAQALAVRRFRQKATELGRELGFSDYTLREVSVSSNDSGMPMPRMMARQSAGASAASAPLPVAAGKSTVTVTVSGAVQLK